eukprot:m.110330 g.110330  ORF g.110330 m.110330 type:complete len:91 (+) comp15269_c1_seq1:895-1167(+)
MLQLQFSSNKCSSQWRRTTGLFFLFLNRFVYLWSRRNCKLLFKFMFFRHRAKLNLPFHHIAVVSFACLQQWKTEEVVLNELCFESVVFPT